MRARALLIGTAVISSILGAIVAYLVLTVPNDIQANALLRQAHSDLNAGKTERARDSLSNIVQQYPRTDAAAAATVALVKIGDAELSRLQNDLAALRRDREQEAAAITRLQQSVEEVKNAPPKTIVVQAPAKPAPKKSPAPSTRQRRKRRR